MSEDLTPRQQILLWDLISRGGSALQKDLRPPVTPKDREPLVKAKMISVTRTPSRAIELTVEEPGWNHLASTPPRLTTSEGSKYDRPILRFVLAKVQAYASAKALVYADIFAGQLDEAPVDASTGVPASGASIMPIETSIRSAFFDIAGRPARDGVRLRALREALPSIDRATLDATLLKMRRSGRANLTNLDNPRDIEAEGDAALKDGGRTFHLLWIDP